MANGHWSQFSHKHKFLYLNPIAVVVSLLLLFISQKFGWLVWVVVFMWIYIITFQYFFKMPLSYSFDLFRTWMVGKNKKSKNYRDGMEL